MKDALWLLGSGLILAAITTAAMLTVIRLDRPAPVQARCTVTVVWRGPVRG